MNPVPLATASCAQVREFRARLQGVRRTKVGHGLAAPLRLVLPSRGSARPFLVDETDAPEASRLRTAARSQARGARSGRSAGIRRLERLRVPTAQGFQMATPDSRPVSDVAFTPAVKDIQTRRGSRRAYAHQEEGEGWQTDITPDLKAWIESQITAYLATANAQGRPYVHHRGGAPGLLA